MEEKTLFALRAPEIGEAVDEYISVPATASTRMVHVYSTKTKILNGSPTAEITTLGCSVDPQRGDWYAVGEELHMGNGAFKVEIHITQNAGDARTAKITLTQDESGNRIVLQLTQEAGVTYTDVLELPPLRIVTVNSDKGSTDSIEVTAYSLGSDGSKVAKSPNVGNAPSWANQVAIEAGSAEHKYKITFTATETNISTTIRTSPVIITCGTATATIDVSQGIPIKKEFTLTGLPLDKPCYLFASGSIPQSGGSGTGYLMIHGLDGQVTMNIPVTVNLSSYGGRTTVDTGGTVTVWTYSGSTFSQIGSFTVPSAGGTVSIKNIIHYGKEYIII